MGVYIKGIEMPKSCLECVFYRNTSPTYDYCCISTVEPKGYVPEDCPLVEEKTGRCEPITKAEWVRVVRCKDCRWGREVCGNIECFVDSNIPSEYHGYEWFCPNGERRSDE